MRSPAVPACARRSAARSLALRARGLRSSSSSPGTTGRFVSTRTIASARSSARKVCLTIRSSSEWKLITTTRPPSRSRFTTSRRNASSPSSSPIHPDAQRLKRARRGVDPLPAARRHRAADDLRQLARRRDRLPAACVDDRARNPPRMALLAELEDDVGEIDLPGVAESGRLRSGPLLRSIRMSSGSSRRKLKPRPSASNCSDDTPRSASAPSIALDARARRARGPCDR